MKLLKELLKLHEVNIDREIHGLKPDLDQSPRGKLKVGMIVIAGGREGQITKFGGDAVYVLHTGSHGRADEYDISEVEELRGGR